MIARFSLLLVAALLALAPSSQAQSLPIQLDIDTGSYLYGDGQSLMEIYVSVGVHTLTFEQTADGYSSSLPVEISVYPASSGAPSNTERAPLYQEMLDLQFQVADTLLLERGREYVEMIRTTIAPGEYDVVARVAANTRQRRPQMELRANDVTVPDYEVASGAVISSVQLASSISRAQEGETAFVKSGLEVQPNPTAVFAMDAEGGGMRSVPYYAEIYGVDRSMSSEEYTVLAYLSQSNRPNPMTDHQQRTTRPVRPVDVVVGRFDVSKVPTGTYYLRIAALNAANEPVAERSQKLYIVNPTVEAQGMFAAGEDFETILFAGMSEEEIDLEIEQIDAISSSRDRSLSARLTDLDAKRSFLAAFWRDRDEDPNPNVNGARRAFFQRMNIVQDRYRESFAEGYKSERGRVFLKYGAPSEVDQRRFEAETIPHVIWYYDNIPGEGRAIFVFADRFGSGRMELLHSDVTGETSVPDWEYELIK